MSDAEFKVKMTELLIAQTKEIGSLHTTVAVNSEKTEAALKQIDEKVDDVKEDVSDLKNDVSGVKDQLTALGERIQALESKKGAFSKIGNMVTSTFSFAKSVLSIAAKFKAGIFVIVGVIVILFGRPLGLDAQATVALLIQLFS